MFDLCPIDWSGLAAIVSFVMVIVTTISLCQNKKQLKEMKRQWDEEHRPVVVFKIKGIGYEMYNIVMENCGKTTAKNIRFHLSQDYLDLVKLPTLKAYLEGLSNNVYQLLPGERISFEFACKEIIAMLDRSGHHTILGQQYSYDELKTNYASMSSQDCLIEGTYDGGGVISQTVGLVNHYIEPFSVEESLSLLHRDLVDLKLSFQKHDGSDTTLKELEKIREALTKEK